MDNNLSSDEINSLISRLIYFYNKCDHNSYSYIKNILDQLSIAYCTIPIYKNKNLFRTRCHLNGEDFFYKVSDISHKCNHFEILEFGRANEPCQSVFYSSDQHENAIIETSKIIRFNQEIDKEIVTTGVWRVEKDLIVASLLNSPFSEGVNKTQELLDLNAKKIITEFLDGQSKEFMKLHTLLSSEFAKDAGNNSKSYLISCAYANYIYSNRVYNPKLNITNDVDGIIYPSSLYPYSGMNLALKSDVIEQGKLKLVGARKSELRIRDDKNGDEIILSETSSIDNENNKINWN